MRIIDLRKIVELSDGDSLVVDGPKGTRRIEPKDLYGGYKIVKVSKEEYDAITEKDQNTIYMVV